MKTQKIFPLDLARLHNMFHAAAQLAADAENAKVTKVNYARLENNNLSGYNKLKYNFSRGMDHMWDAMFDNYEVKTDMVKYNKDFDLFYSQYLNGLFTLMRGNPKGIGSYLESIQKEARINREKLNLLYVRAANRNNRTQVKMDRLMFGLAATKASSKIALAALGTVATLGVGTSIAVAGGFTLAENLTEADGVVLIGNTRDSLTKETAQQTVGVVPDRVLKHKDFLKAKVKDFAKQGQGLSKAKLHSAAAKSYGSAAKYKRAELTFKSSNLYQYSRVVDRGLLVLAAAGVVMDVNEFYQTVKHIDLKKTFVDDLPKN